MDRHTTRRTLALLAGVALVLAAGAAAAPASPVNTAEPTITGVAVVSRTLEASRGTWTGTGITYSYRWLRCDPAGGDDSSDKTCTDIDGATRQTYTITSADLGKRMRVRVTAKNASGSGTATSTATSVVTTAEGNPASSAAPTISGAAVVGSRLSGSTGSWVGDQPITFQYQWLRCDGQGNSCGPIAGRTENTYTVGQADVGRTLRFRVVAKNARGTGDAFSLPTDVVKDSGGSGGIINLPNGEKSVEAKDVPRDQRLVVDQVQFSPNPVTSKNTPITVRIKVKDTRGYVVRNATVFIRSTPKVTSGGDKAPTATDGWVQYSLLPENDMTIRNGYSVQFYVKAYRAGDPTLGGIYGSRLVQVATRT